MEERRSSRIPRATVPITPASSTPTTAVPPRPLAEKNVNKMAPPAPMPFDRKRKLEPVQEVKRPAPSAPRPTRSAPAPAPAVAITKAVPVAFPCASEGTAKATGPAPGEEPYEDIRARTGATELDILSKKLAWKKGIKPEKKVDEMVPIIKELRAVGWYLLADRDRVSMDCSQWKTHCDEVEAALTHERAAWNKKQDEIESQMKEIQGLLTMTEDNSRRLTTELTTAETLIAQKSAALQAAQQSLTGTTADLERAQRTIYEKEAKVKEMEDVMRQSQAYSATLQSYNTSLQSDLQHEKARRDEASRERDLLQGKVAELGGLCKSLEQQLEYERDQVSKLREGREVLARDVALLRTDLDSTRQERDRLLVENTQSKAEVERIRTAGGRSLETLEALSNDKATMELQLSTQQRLLGEMRQELALAKEHRALAESQAGTRGTQISEMQAQLQEMQQALAKAETRVLQGEVVRRKLHNIIQELKGNIRVFCRVRPVSSAEQSSSEHDSSMAVEFGANTEVLGAGISLQVPTRGSGDAPAAPAKHSFTFDKVFGPASTQTEVFEEISELVQSALDGHKVCIFAYGQTGSGKTHTMLGTAANPGMIPLAMHQVFDTSRKLGSQGWTFNMAASMLEIYNEEYKDLLCKTKKDDRKHQVQHNADGTTLVTDMVVIDVSTAAKVDSLLSDAMDKRTVGCTQLNEHSSRSHMVFMLRIDGVNTATGQVIAGSLNLIDLAGSERVKESGASGQQMKEAQSINKSLSALGDVIVAIANKEKHIPYRNSKLTYLLQPCLGGDAKTLMFVNIAPSKEFAPESLCSLRFAAKVNACEINPKRQGAARQ